MAKGDGSLRIRIVGDARDLNKSLSKASNKVTKFGKSMSNVGSKMTKWVTGPMALAGGAAAKFASDLEQSVGAVESVFGKASDKIEAFGDTAADSLGLSRREVNETASVLGAQLKSMGRSTDEAAKEVIQLQRRAADMAATFGGSTREALEAIGSLMRGERDPIEKFGVSLKQVDINARIAAMGLDTSTTAAQKSAEATAAMNILLEQTADVEGQFAREADTAAGSQQRLQAQLENTAAEIGENLLPMKVRATEALRGLTGAFDGLSPAAQNTILGFAGLTAAAGPLFWAIGTVLENTSRMVKAFNLARAAAIRLNASAWTLRGTFLTGLGIGVTVAAVYELQQAWRETAQETDRAVDRMIAASTSQEDAVEKVGKALQEHKDEVTSLERIWGRVGHGLTGPIGAFHNARNAVEDASRALGLVKGQSRAANAEFESTGEILPSVTQFMEGLNDPLDMSGGLLDKFGEAAGEADSKAKELSRTADELKDQIDQLNGSTVGVERAAIAWGNQIGSLDEELSKTANTLDVNTEEGRANRDMLLDTAEAAQDHVKAMIDDGASTEQATRALQTHVGELRAQAIQGGLTEAQIDSYISTLKLTPDHIKTLVEAETEQAEAKIASYKGWLDSLPDTKRTAVELVTQGFGGPSFGGSFPTGHSGGVVGDLPLTRGLPRGNEQLVKAEPNERLLTAGQNAALERLLAGGGTHERETIRERENITIVTADAQGAARSLARENRDRSYLRGG